MRHTRLLFLGFLLLLASCGKDSTPAPAEAGFSREAFLKFTVDYWITPGFTKLESDCDSLVLAAEGFRQSPGEASLAKLRQNWKTAFLTWQRLNAFQFGPAGEDGIRKSLFEEIGLFPVRRTGIDQILQTGQFNMADFNRDTRGFLCLDYLLFAGTDADILPRLSQIHASNYLVAVATHIRDQVKRVRNTWASSYGKTFLEQKGTEVGSSTSLVYNSFVKSYEGLKNFKVALPLGKRPGQTSTDTTLLEACYSGLAMEAIQAHFQGISDYWNGGGFHAKIQGPGFSTYLRSVEGGPALVVSTQNQISVVQTTMTQVNGRTNSLFAAADPSLENLNTELQKLTRYFKSDMSSILGIAITFSSNDGD